MGLDWPSLDQLDVTIFAMTLALGMSIAVGSYALLNWVHV